MTVSNSTFKITTKRKEHPNAVKYQGRPTMEFGSAFRSFILDLSEPEKVEAFLERRLVFEEEMTAEFFDSIQVGDVIGLGLASGFDEIGENPHDEAAAYKFKVLEIPEGQDILKVRNVTFESDKPNPRRAPHVGTELEVTFEDVSCGLGMSFAEILMRDGKPFGVSEEVEINVKFVDAQGNPLLPVETEDEATEASASPAAPATTAAPSESSAAPVAPVEAQETV